ncbi:MAG: cytochrome c3 family protein [Desulfuromonas thiophila]|nr:cytochrome c3 family protein [Desulfuromonas thiophila]
MVVCCALLGSGLMAVASRAEPAVAAGDSCLQCHETRLQGVHAGLDCLSCHGAAGNLRRPADGPLAPGCQGCHAGSVQIFQHVMATRAEEQAFCRRSWGQADADFFQTNCQGCHVSSCHDCHGDDGHALRRPDNDSCLRCHNGYFVGWDYLGRAPREDHERYQRGPQAQGQHYLKMRPDVHAEAGLVCGDCHAMAGLQQGLRVSRTCRDCHTPAATVIEHGIAAHLERLSCSSCHAAWSAQEYGTFYLKLGGSSNRQYFRVRPAGTDYVKSSYLRRQDGPLLGLNDQGLVSPIRPQFLAYYSEMRDNQPVGQENRLLAAEWKAYAPHSIRRGAPLCDACHGDARRFLLQPPERRIYRPDLDGLGLADFWHQQGQRLRNGSFFPQDRFDRLTRPSPAFVEGYVRKWQTLLPAAAASSKP